MKNKFIYALSAVALLLTSCEFEHPYPTVLPDPIFPENGVQVVETNLAYESYVETISIERTYGLSKELELNIVIDEALVEEQNTINGTTYTVLDSKYYEIPQTVTFEPNTKSTKLQVTFKPYAMAKDMGLEAANNAVLPIRIEAEGIEDKAYLSELMLSPSIATPQLTVQLPEQPKQLSFVPVSKLTQTVDLVVDANFNNVDVSKLEWVVVADAVKSYNDANGTNYSLLTKEYEIGTPVFDKDNLTVTTQVKMDCYKISGSATYLLPLQLTESHDDYVVNQSEIYYVIVSLTELKVWVDQANTVVDNTSGKGTIKVMTNAPMDKPQPIVIKFAGDKVAPYNAANGTAYLGVDAKTVTVAETAIPAGALSVEAEFNIDISGMEFDSPDAYLVPFVLDKDKLVSGTITEGEQTLIQYMKVQKTLVGTYQREMLPSGHTIDSIKANENYGSNAPEIKENQGEIFGNRIMLVGTGTATDPMKAEDKGRWKYAISWHNTYENLVYFNILMDQPVPGKENCVRLGDFCDRPHQNSGGYDPLVDSGGSYVNTVTGEVFIDIAKFGYWDISIYSVRLYDKI